MNLPSRDGDNDKRRSPTAIEVEIARELAQLPKMEQLKTTQDVEGRNLLAAAEPSKLVQLGLGALDKRIRELIETSNEPSLSALLQSNFACDRKLHLKMLRSENFDSELAAKRMVKFLFLSQEVLGLSDERGSVLRPVELTTDFTQEERDRQDLGALQLLLFRDQAGRRVAGCFDVETPTSSSDNINLEVSHAFRTLTDPSMFDASRRNSHRRSDFVNFQAITLKRGLLLVSSGLRRRDYAERGASLFIYGLEPFFSHGNWQHTLATWSPLSKWSGTDCCCSCVLARSARAPQYHSKSCPTTTCKRSRSCKVSLRYACCSPR
jgi:hypothetical protein